MNIIEYTEFLVKSICEEDLVKVSSYIGEDENVIIDIAVPEKVLGSVIGKDGKNISAIRTLVNAYNYLHEKKQIEINVESF